jgi:uncharacterized protein YjbJ (UPF0337 family)
MGMGEKIKGAAKKKASRVLDDDQLRAEGEAQQRKADEQTRESKDRAEAQAHEKKADALEKEQEALDD